MAIRTFTKRLFIIINIVVAALFLLACSNVFLRPDKWWFVSLLGLLFPLLLLLVFGFFIFWLLFYSRRLALISLLVMIIGWKSIHAFFAFNFNGKWMSKPANGLRVLTWNVRGWDEFITRKPGASGHRDKMMQFIHEQNPDLLCFQEFFETKNPKWMAANIAYLEQLGYPYHFFSHDYRRQGGGYETETGVIIFSKFPIIDSLQIKYKGNGSFGVPESLIAADINVNGKMIRLFTTHLQSVMFRSKDFRDVSIIKNVDDSMLEASKSLTKKLKRAYTLRCTQADLVRQQLDQSPYPVIACGDFNDVPNSYSYFRILGNRQDAFIKKGSGIGRTYVHLSPTLRIDYIIAAKQFEVLQCKRFVLPYSDHHPIIADFLLPEMTK